MTEYALTAADITPSNALSFPGLYTYGDSSWGDLLTMFNGYPITYDEIGNPTVYTLPNYYSAQLLWSQGRQLSAVNMGGTWYYYGYNDEGVRVYKNGGAYYHNYTVDGTRVITDSWGDNILIYLYDADGSPIGMQYRNVSVTDPEQFYTYWFEKNLQGDIVAIYNASGVKLITYAYDAWGLQTRTVLNSSGTNIYAQYNCLTYRGYFYDQETGLYYLNSRYYNPVTKRFLNCDKFSVTKLSPDSLSDKNLYAYCDNNPVIRNDVSGAVWETVFDVISLGASIVEVCINPTDPWAWAGVIGDAVDLIPFVTGVGEVTRAVKTGCKIAEAADTAIDVAKTTKKVNSFTDATKAAKKFHGNSLKCERINYGYVLLDKNKNILKFGETLNPTTRYSQKFLKKNNYTMQILEEGSKEYIHYWQYDMNMYYKSKYGVFPPLNKRGW